MKSLQLRIIVLFGLLMVGVQLGGLALLDTVGVSNARVALDEELVVRERVFGEWMKQRTILLAQAARVLAADYAFRQALASHDSETIESALDNHGKRINAQLMMLVDLDRRVVADTSAEFMKGVPFPLPALIGEAKRNGSASSIVTLGDHVYQLVIMPVAAPLPVGWIVVGFAIDDGVANELQRITALGVTFLSHDKEGTWKTRASTMPADVKPLIERAMDGDRFASNGNATFDGKEYATRLVRQSLAAENRVVAVLQLPLDEALEPFYHLLRQFAGLALVGVLVAMFFSVVIARGIAGPVQQLAAFARRIASGDYSDPPRIARVDEIGDLSTAFDHMREGIESRESRIRVLAYRDDLTGLPNRALFADRLQQATGHARREQATFSVLIMDLDRFKYVNDTLGHHIGDILLRQVAERLTSVMKRETDTVARLGGDEFAILLPAANADTAHKVALKILRTLEEPMTLDGHLVDVHASIGIATSPEHGHDLEILMRRADVAMYLAKRTNAGVALYDVAEDQHSAERLSLMSELRQAVEHDQLVVHYQPKVGLAESSQQCVEALVRWQHPRRGFIPPSEFIPFAEQTGYIRRITLWMLEHVTAQVAEWQRNGMAVKVAVNISARDLLNADLPVLFAQMLERHGCDAESIWLEITESAILEDTAHVIANLERLSAQGCKLSIDDYGTGYSSLSYLKRLPVDELKIDRSFIMNMMTNHDDRVIVKSTIDLAHNMGLTVTAEGVEDQETLDRLRAMGCDMAQGFLMSRPIPAIDLARWMKESKWVTRPVPPVRLVVG